MSLQFPRRSFLKSAVGLAAVGLGTAPVRAALVNSKLRTAHIGVGGMGGSDLSAIASHTKVEVAALCDVDRTRLDAAAMKHPNAKLFRDYREMIASLGNTIDAVVVSTPDHTHAPASMTALLANKPVYCQKPLTHEVFEARQLRLVAEKKGIVTQMGIQVHSSAPYRQAVDIIRSGAIGKVSQVHVWSGKNWGYDGEALKNEQPVPETLDWNLWLGTASDRPYIPQLYHPGAWRKMLDFGTGTLGDMGVHIFDTPYTALELTAPRSAKTTCRPPTGIGHPEKNLVEYDFPATKYTTETLAWKWYDGTYSPPSTEALKLPADFKLPSQGAYFIGEGGSMLLPHVGEGILFPKEKFADFKRPDVKAESHYHQWVDACLGEGKTSASFSYGGPLTEALLLGVVANRFPGKELLWDAANLKVTNLPEANALLKREYRKGFAVEQLS